MLFMGGGGVRPHQAMFCVTPDCTPGLDRRLLVNIPWFRSLGGLWEALFLLSLIEPEARRWEHSLHD